MREANVTRLIEGQGQIKDEMGQHRKDTNDRLDGKIDQKFGKLIYGVLGLAGGLIALLVLEGLGRV